MKNVHTVLLHKMKRGRIFEKPAPLLYGERGYYDVTLAPSLLGSDLASGGFSGPRYAGLKGRMPRTRAKYSCHRSARYFMYRVQRTACQALKEKPYAIVLGRDALQERYTPRG